MKTIIPIGSDHAGFELKQQIIKFMTEKGYEMKDFGCFSSESIDYPDYGHPVADFVTEHEKEGVKGIVICGSGNGINMTVNKHQAIRSALCWQTEIAKLARLHNDANIIALPARFVDSDLAKEMVDIFFNTAFEGGRHLKRIQKIPCGCC
jgi:ribose 5-phosphate isomerase B